MIIRLFIGSILPLLVLLVAAVPAFADLSSAYSLRAPLNQRDKFDTDIFTGSATYSYPFKVPKGTNDLTPDVSLTYSSAGVRDLRTYAGIGWQLNRDYVERDTNDSASDTGDDTFKLHFKGAVHDLVYVSGDGRYHTKIESNLHIKKLTGGDGDNDDYWQVITPDGTKYRFGYATTSELICETRNYTKSWSLDQVTDTHNNKIYYSYFEYAGVSHLSEIEYNNDESRKVIFTYGSNPYNHPTYLQGCGLHDMYRLNSVKTKIGNDQVREYTLGFDEAQNGQPLLASITEKGSDGSSLPATTFDYNESTYSWHTPEDLWLDNAALDYLSLDNSGVVMADVNGDALTDIVKTYASGSYVTWKVVLNQGDGWATSFETWVNNQPIEVALDRSDTRLIDVTGDGLPDIVKSSNGSGSGKSTWDVFRNTGSSWNTSVERWVDDQSIDAVLTSGQTQLMDVTGDGLADIVKSHYQTGTPPTWKVYKNTGSTWSTSYESWTGPMGIDLSSQELKLVDVNGDNLPDLVKTVHTGTLSTWYVYRNKGDSWGSQEMWLDGDLDAHFLKDTVTLSDVNGDGLVDIVKGFRTNNLNNWYVLLNLGDHWSSSWQTWLHQTSIDINPSISKVKMADVNGDGLSDIVKGEYVTGGNVTWRVLLNNGHAPDLLETVHTPQGGVLSFTYNQSTEYDNTGADSLSDLPFSMWVVDSMTMSNGLSNAQGTNDVTTYTYKDGYYKWQDKDFRGFKNVNTVEPNTAKKQYVFYQSDELKGRLLEQQTRDSGDDPYAETQNDWSYSTSGGVTTVKLAQEQQYLYDGNPAFPKILENEYEYDSYGNVTKKSELGDLASATDNRYIYNEYTVNTTDWIVNTLRHTWKKASDDSTKVSEKWLYYDGHTWIDDAPTYGDVTKEVSWLDGGTSPINLFEYDSYGSLTEETDANNHATTYTYDSTHTYPESVTNAKGHVTETSYDLGTGNLLSKTDPNGKTTTYTYDVFGRLSKEIKPYDSSTYPTTLYTYITDGVDGTKVAKRETSSSSATLDTYTWVDGLGRTIQTRRDAENTSNQIVTNTYYDSLGQVSEVSVPHEDGLVDYYDDPVASVSGTQTDYDVIGRPIVITNPKGDDKTIAYDHWKETVIDENGHIKRILKNGFEKIHRVEEVNNGSTYTTNYTYDPNDQLTQITDHADNDITFTYDTLGRKTSQTDPDMGTWEYEYDGVGNLTKQTDNRDVEVDKTYDELNRLTKTDYPTDTDVTYLYDANARKGTLSIATDSAGMVKFLYDDRLRKTEEQRSVNGTTKTTAFSYDAADRTVTQTNPDSEVVTNTFNAQGEIESVTGSSTILSNINYNALNKVTSKAFANGKTTSYTYNTDDFRLNRIQTPSVQDMQYTYDAVGNVKTIADNVASKTQTFGYDDLDRLTVASESAGFNYQYEYNPIGNLTQFSSGDTTIDYNYGANGKPHAMTSSTEATVPPAPQVTGTPLTSSLRDDWTSGAISASKWNNWGGGQVGVTSNQLTMTSTTGGGYYGVDSEVAGKVYNLTGSSIVNKVVSAGNQSIGSWEVYPIYAYVSGDSSTQYFFYISENTLRAYKKVSGSNTVLASTTYNSTNHKWFRIRESGGMTYFDTSANGTSWSNFASTSNAFTLTSMVIGSEVGTWSSEGSTTTATFDNFNYASLPTSLLSDDWSTGEINSSMWADWSGGQADVVDEELQMSSTTGGGYYGVDSDASGMTYDLTGSYVVNQLVSAGNQSLGSWEVYPIYAYVSGDSSTQYFFYLSENTLRAYKKVSGSNTVLASTTYNATNHKWFRLRESAGTTYFETSPDGITWNSFASTANAFNVTSLVIGSEVGTWSSEGSTTMAVMDNFNVWTPTYTYDANGNMTSDGQNCYTYNEANQLSVVKTCTNNQTISEYVYDLNGNRMVKKTYEGGSLKNTITSWSDSYETKVINGGGTENTTYYFVNGELVSKKDNSGNRTYFHNDHLGSVSLVTNSSGNVVESTKYDPWGEVKSGGMKSKFLYTGQEQDNETGLKYYNARYYDSHIRRFTQPDDIIQNVYDPQTLNRYTYVRNNPLRYTDPTGHLYEILSYNSALNQYYSKPNAKTYNNVLSTARSIQTQFYQPEKDKSVAKDVAKPAYNTLLGNDIKTVQNPNSTTAQKTLASVSILGNVYLPAKGVKGFKAADGLLNAGKRFNPDQAALIDLAKESKKTGVSNTDADTLLKWGSEYGIIPTLDHRSPTDALHWDPFKTGNGIPHIRIGSQNHIEVK